MRELIINDTVINDDSECFVIAEVGHNHQGNVDTAKQIFDKAKDAGANAVKLQKRDNKFLFTEQMYNSSYSSENAYGMTGELREAINPTLVHRNDGRHYSSFSASKHSVSICFYINRI